MASGVKEPPDASLTKYYKCHPNTKVGAVVCILCESVFHTNEFVTKYNAGSPVKFISNALVICQDHANVALTSNLPYGSLSEPARQLIAEIKLAKREEIKQEIISEIDLEKQKGHDETIYEDYSEIQSLKIENQLLKQLNTELQDKNKILNELLTKEKQGNNTHINKTSNKTFAEVITNAKPKSKRIPKLIIKKTNDKDNTNLENTVLHYLTKDKTIQTKSVTCKNKDTVVINCMNEESINTIEKTLIKKLTNNFKIEKEQIAKPKLKVINIDKAFGNDKEIEQDINQRNFSNMDDKCKVLHVFTNTITKKNSAIIEVTADIYKHIKENKSRLFIGYQSCRVFDVINTNPCNNCARFGHSSKKCYNQAVCLKCGGAHQVSECTSETNKCPNCEFSNIKFNTKYNINHNAVDSELCEILKTKIKKCIEMTDYPIQPIIPRYFGKIDRPQKQQFTTHRRARITSSASLVSLQSNSPASSKTNTPINNG